MFGYSRNEQTGRRQANAVSNQSSAWNAPPTAIRNTDLSLKPLHGELKPLDFRRYYTYRPTWPGAPVTLVDYTTTERDCRLGYYYRSTVITSCIGIDTAADGEAVGRQNAMLMVTKQRTVDRTGDSLGVSSRGGVVVEHQLGVEVQLNDLAGQTLSRCVCLTCTQTARTRCLLQSNS